MADINALVATYVHMWGVFRACWRDCSESSAKLPLIVLDDAFKLGASRD